MPFVVARSTEVDDAGNRQTRHSHGIGNSNAGVKYRFYDNDAPNLALAVYPQVDFHTPGARTVDDGGGASRATSWQLPFILTKELRRLAITANTGLDITTEHPHTAVFAVVGMGTRLSDKLALLHRVLDVERDGDKYLQ